MDATDRLKKARTQLLLTNRPELVFVAHLCCVPDKIDASIDTACTDGTVIRWNPAFVQSCTDSELFGVLVHELMHIGLLHTIVCLQYQDSMEDLNIAADLAINSVLHQSGVELPEGGVLPGTGDHKDLPHGLSMEQYLQELRKAKKDGKSKPGNGASGKGQAGKIEPAGSEAARNGKPSDQVELQIETLRAQVKHAEEKVAGIASVPAVMKDAIRAAQQRKVDFKQVLRHFRNKIVRGGSDWSRLNRRLQAVGVSAARNKRRAVGDVVVLLDVSGSMNDETVSRCMAEIVSLFGSIDGDLHIWQHDTRVVRKDVWEHGKPLPVIARAGKGGTSHQTLFDAIEADGLKPEVVICLTDMCTSYPTKKPSVPVVWITTESTYRNPPFGQVCHTVI
jgi:predicted metal-dependent peptidase